MVGSAQATRRVAHTSLNPIVVSELDAGAIWLLARYKMSFRLKPENEMVVFKFKRNYELLFLVLQFRVQRFGVGKNKRQ